jgi:hypothetical protein
MTMAFKLCHNDLAWESFDFLLQALFDYWNVQNIRVVLQITHEWLPMGAIDFYFVDNELEDCCRWKVVDYAFDFSLMLSIIMGCTTSAPDGSSPRGYSQKKLGIGSKYTYCHLNFSPAILLAWLCLDALPYLLVIGAPESMSGFIVLFYILQCCSSTLLFILITLHVSFPCPLYAVTALFSARGKI